MELKSLLAICSLVASAFASDCRFDISSGSSLVAPIITNEIGDFILPDGSTDDDRSFALSPGKEMVLSCAGSEFDHESVWEDGPVFAKCKSGQNIEVSYPAGNEEVTLQWEDMGCRSQPDDNVTVVGECGPDGKATRIEIGFQMTDDEDAVTITVCHDQTVSRTLWARHVVYDEIVAQDHGNDRPSFKTDQFFDYDVNEMYTRVSQKAVVADYVGNKLADQYVQDSGDTYMARGHLAPNADFIFYSWMDSSFHFINVAPQWQTFNGKNWMYLESGVRDFIMDRAFDAVIYTGTHGVMELKNEDDEMVEIYLYQKSKLPVPRFYWKIITDPERNLGVAVVGVNNPHLEMSEIEASYILCPVLDNPSILSSVYSPEDIQKGYMYACRVEDLALRVPEIPDLPPMNLLD